MKHSRPALTSQVALVALLVMHSSSLAGANGQARKSVGAPETRCAVIDRSPGSDHGTIFQCRIEREESDQRLLEQATSSNGNPVLEARHSADAGDFRLMGYSMLVPGMFPAAYGFACRPSIVSQGMRMVRALYAASDLPPMSEADAANREHIAESHRAFGEKYNAALISDKRSPYRNVCRAVSRDLETAGGPFRTD
jgi:hypothetical protein